MSKRVRPFGLLSLWLVASAHCGPSASNTSEPTTPASASEGSSSGGAASPMVPPPASPSPPSESAACPNAVPRGTEGVMRQEAPPDVAAIPGYAHVNPSGLASCVVRPGDGTHFPSRTDRVTVQYAGWRVDSVMFDSSIPRGRPATFPLDAVIAGWTEGVAMMTPGEIRRLWIPEALAYRGRPGRPAGMLIFDVELISIEPAQH